MKANSTFEHRRVFCSKNSVALIYWLTFHTQKNLLSLLSSPLTKKQITNIMLHKRKHYKLLEIFQWNDNKCTNSRSYLVISHGFTYLQICNYIIYYNCRIPMPRLVYLDSLEDSIDQIDVFGIFYFNRASKKSSKNRRAQWNINLLFNGAFFLQI